jgi:hypothetical protein
LVRAHRSKDAGLVAQLVVAFVGVAMLAGGSFVLYKRLGLGQPGKPPRIGAFPMRFQGSASGGTLFLVAPEENFQIVSVQTAPGESAASVSRKIAEAIADESYSKPAWSYRPERQAFEVAGRRGCAVGGSETGLGIPPPPFSASARYDPERKSIEFCWERPPEGYDAVRAHHWTPPYIAGAQWDCCRGTPWPDRQVWRGQPGEKGGIVDTYNDVVGWKGGSKDLDAYQYHATPSAPGLMHVTFRAQDELFSLPFYRGIAPNWEPWIEGGAKEDGEWSEGLRESAARRSEKQYGSRYFLRIKEPREKSCFQLVRTRRPGVAAGIWRKFLGLTPGHKYRVSVILSTLEMDKAEGDWSLSFHAAASAEMDSTLSAEQMAGEAALPDGTKGPEAGRVVAYGPAQTTKGEWSRSSTDPQDKSAGRVISDLTLPAGADTITVWLRHQAEHSPGVGYLYIKLEDLSMQLPPTGTPPARP